MVITFLCSSLETCIPFFGKETNNNNNNKTVRLSRAMHDSRSTPCMRLSGRKPNCPRFFTTVAVCLALDFFYADDACRLSNSLNLIYDLLALTMKIKKCTKNVNPIHHSPRWRVQLCKTIWRLLSCIAAGCRTAGAKY